MKSTAPFRWPRKQFIAAMARANAAKAPAGEPNGRRARELLEFIRTEVERSGEFPSLAAIMAAMGVKHASTLDATLLRLLGAGFIARDVVARKGTRRFYAYRLPTEQPKQKETLKMQTVDLTRPEGAPSDLYAVFIIGSGAGGAGPWQIRISQQPAQELRKERSSYGDAVVIAVFWTSRANCHGIENHLETTKLVALRGKQNLRAPVFLMPGEKAAVLIADAAKRLTLRPYDPETQRDAPGANETGESAGARTATTMLRESARAVLRGGQ